MMKGVHVSGAWAEESECALRQGVRQGAQAGEQESEAGVTFRRWGGARTRTWRRCPRCVLALIACPQCAPVETIRGGRFLRQPLGWNAGSPRISP